MAGTYGHHGEETHDSHGEHTALAMEHGHPVAMRGGGHAEETAGGHVHRGPHGMNPVAALLVAPAYYLWNFAPHLFKPKPGESPVGWLADMPVWGLLLLLELIGAMIKPFALCMRLFANMIAGHIVLAVLAGLIPVTLGIAGAGWHRRAGDGVEPDDPDAGAVRRVPAGVHLHVPDDAVHRGGGSAGTLEPNSEISDLRFESHDKLRP